MKLKLLLLFTLTVGILYAQEPEPYRQLLITEIYTQRPNRNYVELTNMGEETINLSEFKLGVLNPWASGRIYDVDTDPWVPQNWNYVMFLPDVDLGPDESFVITGAYDFGPRRYKESPYYLGANQRPKNPDWYELADLLLHFPETNGDDTDSITTHGNSPYSYHVMNMWDGRNAVYLEHHFAEGDSATVDQFGGVFDDDGRNYSRAYDVAGVENATASHRFARKYSVKTGNLNFADARGLGLGDSEWIPILYGRGSWRDVIWTVGNHGDYVLDENTLRSDVIDVDFANKTLTVPWGVRRLDGIMHHMEYQPGTAWEYSLNPNQQDSIYRSAQTGDTLTVILAGSERQEAKFVIEVEEPTEDANIVVPIDHKIISTDPNDPIVGGTQSGILPWPRVTQHETGPDTITGNENGLPFALRTDSLVKYLEKPDEATWEFVWVDGVERAEVKDGDKLKVTAENGDEKEYYIQVRGFIPSDNANLQAITWPDIPDFYRGVFGWMGDTIPNFSSSSTSYKVMVPLDVDGIPALQARKADLNSEVTVQRATSLSGTTEDRTVKFMVTAEDDTTTMTYNVELLKQQDPAKVQPFYGEPFLSEMIDLDMWFNNFAEVTHAGNQPLDLSNYMFTFNFGNNPADHITHASEADDWEARYRKYIPGTKWVGEEQWAVTPGRVETDLAIDPIVPPGDVFAMGYINNSGHARFGYLDNFPNWTWGGYFVDINFSYDEGDRGLNMYDLQNPWGENPSMVNTVASRPVSGRSFMIFKILNDSVRSGEKPATDPNDFELVDIVGNADASGTWVIDGNTLGNRESWRRKPHVYEGNSEAGFADTWEESEWVFWDTRSWSAWGHPAGVWHTETMVASDIGRHTLIDPTHYKSTVTSTVYKVSPGYVLEDHDLQIRGIITGSTVSEFMDNINKADPDQMLSVNATANGQELTGDAILSMNDTLVVVSADTTNMSKYLIEVTDEGLSSNAVLTSERYTIDIEDEPMAVGEEAEAADGHIGTGTVTGFEYGTLLRTLVNNVTVPAGATMDVIDADGAYVPMSNLNSDTAYVDITVSSDVYFNVTAENGVTTINYQLLPQATESDAFVLSNVYTVIQRDNLIKFVPRGTNAETFLSYLIPSTGASLKVVNKLGHERTIGDLYQDDKLVVTSADGQNQRVYYISMLRTPTIQNETEYLAYVLSDVYSVDQVDYRITLPDGDVTLVDFYSGIEPAAGATTVVVNSEGEEKTSGDLDAGDQLKVTSADGAIEVMYDIDFVVNARKIIESAVQLYPNPTTGKVNISGLASGARVQVFNQTGVLIKDIKANNSLEVLSLENQAAGLYFFVITKEAQLLGNYKLILK